MTTKSRVLEIMNANQTDKSWFILDFWQSPINKYELKFVYLNSNGAQLSDVIVYGTIKDVLDHILLFLRHRNITMNKLYAHGKIK